MSDIASITPALEPMVEPSGNRRSSASRQPRLWPGVLIVCAQWLVMLVPGWVAPATMTQFLAKFWGPIVGAGLILVWWLCFSRGVRWGDRLLAVVTCALIGLGMAFVVHRSYLYGLILYGLPTATTAWVAWLVLSKPLPWPVRRAGLLLVIILAWGWCGLVRLDGVHGDMAADVSWRWSPTAEERFLAERGEAATEDKRAAALKQPLVLGPGDWSEFRGPRRDGRAMGVRIATDWTQRPPRQIWKQRIGPGWSSFAVVGNYLFTQEQRGEQEVVVCYRADTGAERWVHGHAARFTEVVSGPGPRATPTFHDGRLYALGASGILEALDADTGKPLWSQDIARDSGAKTPIWGFSSSPLVAHGFVTVHAGGPEGKGVLAYQADTGKLAWTAPTGPDSYGSPHLARLAGAERILMVTGAGLTAIDPRSGKVALEYDWPMPKGLVRVIQPAVLNDAEILLGTGFGMGTRRLKLTASKDGLAAEEVWTTVAIKPYYNDLVVHGDHLYGFDGIFFVCVSLADGANCWRARGYGNGQVLLLAEQGLLLVLSEKGEAVLLEANPEKHSVVGRFQALTGKTWNHPVVAHGKLFVRNSEEMACYDVAEKNDP